MKRTALIVLLGMAFAGPALAQYGNRAPAQEKGPRTISSEEMKVLKAQQVEAEVKPLADCVPADPSNPSPEQNGAIPCEPAKAAAVPKLPPKKPALRSDQNSGLRSDRAAKPR